jgi:enoyl-CoA hydratase/carnithine racemase
VSGPRLIEPVGPVLLLDLGSGENRFTVDSIERLRRLLDEVAREPAPKALVILARGKFFSNGLDLSWMRAQLPARTAHTAMTTGRRYGAAEALAAGIADACEPTDEGVLARATELATGLAENAGAALGVVRARLYASAISALRADTFTATAEEKT